MKPQIALIIGVINRRFGLSKHDLRSPRRDKPLVDYRHMAMYLAREFTPYSLSQIGRAFGGRDHTSVMHGIDRMKRLIETSPAIKNIVSELQEAIRLRLQANETIDGLCDDIEHGLIVDVSNDISSLRTALHDRVMVEPETVLKGLRDIAETPLHAKEIEHAVR